MKFYVVAHGRNIGAFATWDQCNTLIKGYKGAMFKSFSHLKIDEAKEYFKENVDKDLIIPDWLQSYVIENQVSTPANTSTGNNNVCRTTVQARGVNELIKSFEIPVLPKDVAEMYVDGSYKDGKISYGIFAYMNNKKFVTCKVLDPSQYDSLRNIRGELMAVMAGLHNLKEKGATSVKIYYDYAGIESWVTGAWQAYGSFQQEYIAYVRDMQKSMTITFEHTKAHSNISGNVIVDKLAAKAYTVK